MLAGIVTFASIVPGLLVSPIAGALLDRGGRVKLVALDYLIAGGSLVLIAGLSAAGALPAWLLVAITVVTSLTGILSATGLRTLFPIMVPRYLWERANAVDSNGYVFASILGPPIAASLIAIAGPQVALFTIAVPFLLAAIALIGVREPRTETATTGRLLADAWTGMRYFWSNQTLRGLGFAVTTANLAGGMGAIVIPIIVLHELGFSDAVVGLVYAVSGVSGMISAFLFGRVDTRGREWVMLVVPLILLAPTMALLFPAAGLLGPVTPMTGLVILVIAESLFGLINGPFDIALFTVRQRRTDPAILGRAFAVSMAFNFLGYPVGSAVTGVIVTNSIGLAILFGVVAAAAAAVLAAVLVPRVAPRAPTVAAASAATAIAGTPAAPDGRPLVLQEEREERLASRLEHRRRAATADAEAHPDLDGVVIGMVRVVEPERQPIALDLVAVDEDLVVPAEQERVGRGRSDEPDEGQPTRVDPGPDAVPFADRLGRPRLAAEDPGERVELLRPERLERVEAKGHAQPVERHRLASRDGEEQRVVGTRRFPIRWHGHAGLEPLADEPRHPAAQAVGGVADEERPERRHREVDDRHRREAVREVEAVDRRHEARDGG